MEARSDGGGVVEEAGDLGIVAVEEVNLEAADAQLGVVRKDLLLPANELLPGAPEDDAHTPRLGVREDGGEVNLRDNLRDV